MLLINEIIYFLIFKSLIMKSNSFKSFQKFTKQLPLEQLKMIKGGASSTVGSSTSNKGDR